VHALLGIGDFNALSAILLQARVGKASRSKTSLPPRLKLSKPFWRFRDTSAKPEKGFYLAVQDLKPDRQFLVNSGSERYPMTGDLRPSVWPKWPRCLAIFNRV
jgi:hypothetical protein